MADLTQDDFEVVAYDRRCREPRCTGCCALYIPGNECVAVNAKCVGGILKPKTPAAKAFAVRVRMGLVETPE